MVTAARDESRFRRNETAGMAGERVGQHIAGVHDRHQLADQFLGVGNAPGIVGRPMTLTLRRGPCTPGGVCTALAEIERWRERLTHAIAAGDDCGGNQRPGTGAPHRAHA